MGDDVTVLTSKKYPFDGQLNFHPSDKREANVVEIDYINVKGRLVSLLSQTPFWKYLKYYFRRSGGHVGISLDPREEWLRSAKQWVDNCEFDFDVVISTFGPKESHLIAHHLKLKNSNIYWIADYRDLWSNAQAHYDIGGNARKAKDIELSTVGQYADLVTTVSQEYAEIQTKYLNKSAIVISNGHDVKFETINRRLKHKRDSPLSNKISFCHTGFLYPGVRDPKPILDALAKLKQQNSLELSVEFIFLGSNTDYALTRSVSSRDKISIKSLGQVARNVAIEHQLNSDFLILFCGSSLEDLGTVPAKIYEYITTGVPILAIGAKQNSAVSRILKETGTGFVVDNNTDSIFSVLNSIICGGSNDGFAPILNKISQHHRLNSTKKLSEVISKKCCKA